MTQPELDQKSSSVNSAKAYMRHVGNGKLKFSENTLKFYVSKGLLKKKREFAKQIRFVDVENMTLESNELAVNSRGVTDRFVVEDKQFAKLIYKSFNEFVIQKGNDSFEQDQKMDEPLRTSPVPQTSLAEVSAKEKARRNLPQQKSTTKSHLAEVYLRNVGKGVLEFSENTLKFYVSKGRLTKKKELAKQIPFIEVENIALDSNELAVTSQGVTQRFVIEDKPFAQLIYQGFNEFKSQEGNEPLKQAEKTDEAPIFVQALTPPREDLGQTLVATLQVVDSLFDSLMCLQGRVDWNHISNYVKRSEEYAKKIVNKKMLETANLDFCLLVSAVADRDVELLSKEGYRLLESVYESFQRVAPESVTIKNAVESYYVLNDVAFGLAVGDADIENEHALLDTSLADLSKGTGMNVGEIVDSMSRLIRERRKEPYVEEARSAFKEQVLTILVK